MGYTDTTNDIYALRDIKMIYGGSEVSSRIINGKTYQLIGTDADSGIPNHTSIWLYGSSYDYGQNPANPAGDPIKELFLEIDGELKGMTGAGWERVSVVDGWWANLNPLTPDKPIYLWMRR